MGLLDSLATGVIGAVTDLPGTLISTGLNAFNAFTANERSKENAQEAFNRSQEAYGSRYQTTVNDMRKAGINPIMAATGGFNVSGQPSMQAPTAPMANSPTMGTSASSAREVAQTAKTQEETRKTIAETDKVIAETEKTLSENKLVLENILKTREETKVATQTERNLVTQMFNLEMDFTRKGREIKKLDEEIMLIGEQSRQTAASAKQLEALTSKVADEKNLLKQQAREISYIADKLKRTADVYNGPLGGIVGGINTMTDALNLGIRR